MHRALLAAAAFGVAACEPAASEPDVPPALIARIVEAEAAARTDPEARVRLGELQLEAELYFDAAETLLKALEQGRDDARVHAGLARAYLELGYRKSTSEAVDACFTRKRDQPDCLAVWGQYLERVGGERALRERRATWQRFLEVAPPEHPKRAYARSSIAQVDETLGPEPPPTLPPPVRTATTAATSTGTGAATTTSTRTTSSTVTGPHAASPPDPSRPIGRLNRFGQAVRRAYEAWAGGDLDAAAAGFEEALTHRPDDPPVLAELARLRQEQGRSADAIRLAERAYQLGPEDPQVRFAFGLVMLRNRRRPDDAIAAWRALLRDNRDFLEQTGLRETVEMVKTGTIAR